MTVNYLQNRETMDCSVLFTRIQEKEQNTGVSSRGRGPSPTCPHWWAESLLRTEGEWSPHTPSHGNRSVPLYLVLGTADLLLRPLLHAPWICIFKKLNLSFYVTALMHQNTTDGTLALQTSTLFSMAVLKQWAAILKKNRNRREQDQNTLKLLFNVSFKLFSVIIEPAVHCY